MTVQKERRPLECEDLRRLVYLAAPALSADGKYGAWLKGISDYESGDVNTFLQETGLEEGAGPVFTADRMPGYIQKSPLYDPKSGKLAFLASDGRPWQLWVYDRAADCVCQLTHMRYGVDAPAWSPNGDALAFEVLWYPEQEDPQAGEMSAEEYRAFQEDYREAPKAAEELIYKLDDAYGFLDGHKTAIGTVNVMDASCRLVSEKDVSYRTPSFAQSGGRILCYGYFGVHCRALSAKLVEFDLQSGNRRRLEEGVPPLWQLPVLEEEGQYLYCGASREGDSVMPEIFSVPCAGGPAGLFVPTEGVCHGVDPILAGDTHLEQPPCPLRKDAEGNVYFLSFQERRSNIFCREKKSRALKRLTDEDCVLGFSYPAWGKMLILKSSWDKPAEIYLFRKEADGIFREARQITRENDWISGYELTEPVPVIAESKDGKVRIRGWAAVPAAGSAKALPAVLDVHGGPEGCYVNGFFFEAQVMAGRKMAVLFCDPRGAAGYGPAFMSEAFAYGPEAVEDYLAFLEECYRLYPAIDPTRTGVTGGSYGGYMTNKLISVTDAFAAAVTQRTWVNPSTSYGTGDMGFYSAGAKGSFMEYMEDRVRRSIMKDIRKVHVPLLILHGEKDYRCALEQGEQVYHALRAVSPKLPVKIVIFPEENHGVTREGKMHNQIRHMKEMADWFSTWLWKEAAENGR